LRPPEPRRKEALEKVTLAPELRSVFQQFADRESLVSPVELFSALLSSEPGRKALVAQGVPSVALHNLKSIATKARAEWRGSAARLAAIQSLSSFGRMLTEVEPPHGRVVERETTIKALVRTLSKMKRRNAIVVGPPG